jgi:PAS domain S-box-containing protein
LQENEKKYHDLVNQSPDGIFIIESSGKILTVNTAICKELEFSEEELLSMNIWDIIPERYLDQYRERLTKILEGKSLDEAAEYEVHGRDGEVLYRCSIGPHYSGKDIIGFQGIARDITARKRVEEALRLSEEKYRTLVDEVNDGFYVTDSAGVFAFANPALARMYGVEGPQALVGRKFFDFFAPEILAELGQAYHSAMQSGHRLKPSTARFVRPDGTRAFIEVKPASMVKGGQIVGSQGVVRDITERKQAEEKIQRQLEQLTALSAIDRVIAANFDLILSLSEILTHVTMQLGIDAADILIFNSDSQILEYAAERGFRTNAVRKAQVRLGESFAGRAALERQLVQIPNLSDEPDNLFLTTLLKGEDFVRYYGVPLITKWQVKGVLEVFHRTAIEPDAEWFDFLNALAGQAAIAIENAMLFESLQRSNLELALAYDATIEGWSRALDLRDKETRAYSAMR